MDKDLQILDELINKNSSPTLRIYTWEPNAISLGYNQPESEINKDLCKNINIDIVKRPTGGRAVLHQGDITYSFVINSELLKNGNTVIASYKEISSSLIYALQELGVNDIKIASSKEAYTKSTACMAISTGADIIYKNKKIIGSAQFRRNNYILQHGSILVNQDFNFASKLLKVPESSFDDCINLKDIINKVPNYNELANAIIKGFEKNFNISFNKI